MGGGAPTGWLGVGRPVGPPVPWPRDMHRALPAPGRVSSSPASRVVPSTVVGALGAGTVPRSGPAGRGPGTTFFSTRTSILLGEALCSKYSPSCNIAPRGRRGLDLAGRLRVDSQATRRHFALQSGGLGVGLRELDHAASSCSVAVSDASFRASRRYLALPYASEHGWWPLLTGR